jgi:3-phenylpropionate/trans-cinnamate dioxygenase ferredoxin reductase subunit
MTSVPAQPARTAERVVIVGASVAGITCAETLRAAGYTGRVTVIGDERETPYNRPPLSKQVLTGEWGPSEARLLPSGDLAAINVDLRLGVRATGVDRTSRVVHVDTAGAGAGGAPTDLPFDALVIATGVTPRHPRGLPRLPGVHVVRTLDDALRLRGDLVGAESAVVVGSGILGSEIAAAAHKQGARVTLVGRSAQLGLGQVGPRLAGRLRALHESAGVVVAAGVSVTGLGVAPSGASDRVASVTLSSGETLPADLVVFAIGCLPAVSWLSGAGLDLADGVVCDEHGVASPGVYAVGDVAAWRDPATGVARRAEHQLNAIEQAQAVARLIATGETSPRPLPFFWSELYGTRIQAYGTFARGGELRAVTGDPWGDRFVAESLAPDGTCVGVVGWSHPREFRVARARVGTIPSSPSALLSTPGPLVGAAKGLPA